MRRAIGLALLFLFSGCQFFQKCDSMVPKIQSGLVDLQSLFPQSARDVTHLVGETERFVRRSIGHVVNRLNRHNFDNTILPVDRIAGRASSAAAILEVMTLVHPDGEVRKAASAGLVAIREVLLREIGTNRELYEVVKAYAASQEHADEKLSGKVSDEQERYLIDMLRDFERAGLGLPDEQLAKVRKISCELMCLETQFETNIAGDLRTITVDRAGLEGLDEMFISSLKRDDAGGYILRLDMPTREMVMKHCAVQTTREAFWVAYENRACPINQPLLEKMVALRDQLARLIGFQSFAHLTIDGQMAKTPENVDAFLSDLAVRSQRKYDEELNKFRSELPAGVELTPDRLFKPWDVAYVMDAYKRTHLDIDLQKVREYFPTKRTLDELLSIYEHFLGLEFRQEDSLGLWHEEVKHVIAYKKSGELVGHLLLDLYPRDNKFTHACQVALLPSLFDDDGVRCPAVVAIIANFPRPSGGDPGLLQLQDVSNFFHEFGHAMHAMLGATRMVGFSGTSVKFDFVEVPSQMFEEWLNEPIVLKQVSCHYKTGEPLSDAMIGKICGLRTFNSGFFVQRQIGAAQLALKLFGPGETKDLKTLEKAIHKQFSHGILYDDRSHFTCAFGHLTQYGARYYSYLWSQVFAYDLFAVVKQKGFSDAATGQRLIESVLGQGGRRDPMDLLRDFLGREPSIDAFVQRFGF